MSDLCKVNTLCLCDPRIKDVHLDTHKGTKMFFSKRGFFVMAGARDTGVVVYDESGNMVKVLEKGQELRGLHAQHPDLGTNMNYPTMPLHFEGLPKSANAKDVEVILDWSAVLMAGVHTLAVYLTALGSHEDKESVYEFRSVGVVAGKVLMGGLAMDDGETILTIRAVNDAKEYSEKAIPLLVDSTPPTCSAITVNNYSYIDRIQFTTDPTKLSARWHCEGEAPWAHAPLSCEWAVGTYPGGDNFMSWSAAPTSGELWYNASDYFDADVEEEDNTLIDGIFYNKDKLLLNGIIYFVSVQCSDQVNLTTTSVSAGLLPDLTPPRVAVPPMVVHPRNGRCAPRPLPLAPITRPRRPPAPVPSTHPASPTSQSHLQARLPVPPPSPPPSPTSQPTSQSHLPAHLPAHLSAHLPPTSQPLNPRIRLPRQARLLLGLQHHAARHLGL